MDSPVSGDVLHKGRKHRKDGKTFFEKETGKKWLKPTYEFGEKLFIKEAKERSGRPKRDWQPRMVEARFVGHHSRTSSIIGLTPDGVIYGQCAKRLPRELRWPKEGWSDLRGLPWDQKPQVRDLPEAAVDPERIVIIQQQPQPQQTAEPRNFYVTRAHVDDNLYGKTPGCPKCNALRTGAKTTASHSQACRDRALDTFRGDDADRA